MLYCVKVIKKFLDKKYKRIQGWNPQKPTKLDGTDPTIFSPYILCHFAKYALCLFVWIGGLWKAVLHGCVVHVDVHEEVMLWDVVCLTCKSLWSALAFAQKIFL